MLMKLFMTLLIVTTVEATSVAKNEIEDTAWCDTYIPSVSSKKPHILLVGDSILVCYYGQVGEALKDMAICAKFATSSCVADPMFLKQLEPLLTQYKFEIIHFNNGLHGFNYSEKEYEAGLEKAIKLIKLRSPSTKIILVLSTPTNQNSTENYLNSRINQRNEIVKKLAKKYHTSLNDLHVISKNHPEYYKDSFHYKDKAIELQSRKVSKYLLECLNNR